VYCSQTPLFLEIALHLLYVCSRSETIRSSTIYRCVWCQCLAPNWEKFAQEVRKDGMPIGVGIVDCMAEADLCRENKVLAFPTLRWYHISEPVSPDYKMDRSVAALTGFAKPKLDMDEKSRSGTKRLSTPILYCTDLYFIRFLDCVLFQG
jgi:hypothetical protein